MVEEPGIFISWSNMAREQFISLYLEAVLFFAITSKKKEKGNELIVMLINYRNYIPITVCRGAAFQ